MELKIADEFDSIGRMDTQLIKMFGLRDTPEERARGTAFWMSIYMRATHPGCKMPPPLLLVGPQRSGKRQFVSRLSRALSGSDGVFVTPGDCSHFLHPINAPILIMDELTSVDSARIKEFAARKSDSVKSEPDVPRPWVPIVISNESNARGFYRIVVERIDFTDFEEDVPKIMAECRELESCIGLGGYERMIDDIESEEFDKATDGMLEKAKMVQEALKERLFGASVLSHADERNVFSEMFLFYVESVEDALRKHGAEPYKDYTTLDCFKLALPFLLKDLSPRGEKAWPLDKEF